MTDGEWLLLRWVSILTEANQMSSVAVGNFGNDIDTGSDVFIDETMEGARTNHRLTFGICFQITIWMVFKTHRRKQFRWAPGTGNDYPAGRHILLWRKVQNNLRLSHGYYNPIVGRALAGTWTAMVT